MSIQYNSRSSQGSLFPRQSPDYYALLFPIARSLVRSFSPPYFFPQTLASPPFAFPLPFFVPLFINRPRTFLSFPFGPDTPRPPFLFPESDILLVDQRLALTHCEVSLRMTLFLEDKRGKALNSCSSITPHIFFSPLHEHFLCSLVHLGFSRLSENDWTSTLSEQPLVPLPQLRTMP